MVVVVDPIPEWGNQEVLVVVVLRTRLVVLLRLVKDTQEDLLLVPKEALVVVDLEVLDKFLREVLEEPVVMVFTLLLIISPLFVAAAVAVANITAHRGLVVRAVVVMPATELPELPAKTAQVAVAVVVDLLPVIILTRRAALVVPAS